MAGELGWCWLLLILDPPQVTDSWGRYQLVTVDWLLLIQLFRGGYGSDVSKISAGKMSSPSALPHHMAALQWGNL